MKNLWRLILKDLRVEARRKELTVTGVSLGLLLAVISYFGVQSAFLKVEFEQALFPAIAWMLFAFAGASSLSRSFDSEIEHEALDALLLAGIEPAILYISKVLSSLVIVCIIFGALFSALFLLFNMPLVLLGPALGMVTVLVLFGYVSLSTLIISLTARARANSLLFPVVLLPLLFPLFFAGVESYALLLVERAFTWSNPWVSLLIGLDVVYFLLGVNLYRFSIRT